MNPVWIMMLSVVFMNPAHPTKKQELLATQDIFVTRTQVECEAAKDSVETTLGQDYLWFYNSTGQQAINLQFSCVERDTM